MTCFIIANCKKETNIVKNSEHVVRKEAAVTALQGVIRSRHTFTDDALRVRVIENVSWGNVVVC